MVDMDNFLKKKSSLYKLASFHFELMFPCLRVTIYLEDIHGDSIGESEEHITGKVALNSWWL